MNMDIPGVSTSFGYEFSKKCRKITKGEKFVKVCLHLCYAEQISLQFDEFFDKKSKIEFCEFEISIRNLLGHPAFYLQNVILDDVNQRSVFLLQAKEQDNVEN